MATHLNLEEQEQLAQLKGFWEQYGRLIIFIVSLLLIVIVGWAGWQFWQEKQARGASELYDQFNSALISNDVANAKRITQEIQTQYASTAYASLSSLVVANSLHHSGDLEGAKEVLAWVTVHGKDEGWNAIAALRLVDILTDQKNYDEALKVLSMKVVPAYAPQFADKRGNVYFAQGNHEEAKKAYIRAYQTLMNQPQLKLFVAEKLGLLGVDVLTLSPVEDA